MCVKSRTRRYIAMGFRYYSYGNFITKNGNCFWGPVFFMLKANPLILEWTDVDFAFFICYFLALYIFLLWCGSTGLFINLGSVDYAIYFNHNYNYRNIKKTVMRLLKVVNVPTSIGYTCQLPFNCQGYWTWGKSLGIEKYDFPLESYSTYILFNHKTINRNTTSSR